MAESKKPRKYKFKNVSRKLVFIPAIRRTLSAGKEWPHVWEGVLDEGTKRLETKEFIKITDVGESGVKVVQAKDPLEKTKEQEELGKKLTKEARGKLEKLNENKEETKATVEPVKATEELEEKPEWADSEAKEEEKSRLDSLLPKSTKKKKKND